MNSVDGHKTQLRRGLRFWVGRYRREQKRWYVNEGFDAVGEGEGDNTTTSTQRNLLLDYIISMSCDACKLTIHFV